MSDTNATETRDYLLSSPTYDQLKRLVQLGLPAAGTLYFTLSTIWGFPYGEQVVGTIAAVNTFLGGLLSYSSKTYNQSAAKYNGAINVIQTENGFKTYSLELNSDPETLDTKSEVTFKINPSTELTPDTNGEGE